jgi:hypothetical protein
MPTDFFRLQPSEMGRERFNTILGALLPPCMPLSVQPYEIDMCWEILVQDEKDGKTGSQAKGDLHGGSGCTFVLVAAARIYASSSCRHALTLCIICNAISMMLDDPLCAPVDRSGSTLCIFNCVRVTSTVDGHLCYDNLELARAKIEFSLLVVFTAEMPLLLLVQQHLYFADPWNVLDFVVIGLSWLSVFVDGPSVAVVRLVKLLRLMRMFKGYRELQVRATLRAFDIEPALCDGRVASAGLGVAPPQPILHRLCLPPSFDPFRN